MPAIVVALGLALAALLLARLDPRRWVTRLTMAAMLGRAVIAAALIWANPEPAPAQAANDALKAELDRPWASRKSSTWPPSAGGSIGSLFISRAARPV